MYYKYYVSCQILLYSMFEEFNELPALRRMRGLPPMPCSPSPELQLKNLRQTPLKPPQDQQEGTLAVAIIKDLDGYELLGHRLGSALKRNQVARSIDGSIEGFQSF